MCKTWLQYVVIAKQKKRENMIYLKTNISFSQTEIDKKPS